MEIKAASQIVSLPPVVAVKPVSVEPVVININQPVLYNVKETDEMPVDGNTGNPEGKRTLNESELTKVTDELNNFMDTMNTDIKFAWHYKTNQLMVQVEDSKTHKILKECPAHEVLDMVARMRDYVGALVDKKA